MIHNPIRKALPDLSNPGVADDLRSGKQLVGADGSIVTGNLPEVTQATPTISVSSGGLITASATQSGGIVEAGSKGSTQQLTTQAAKTVTPGTTNQTAVASGRYTTGTVQVAGDANLVPENIAEGVSIFGVTGTHSGGGLQTANVTINNAISGPGGYSAFITLGSDGETINLSDFYGTVSVAKNAVAVITYSEMFFVTLDGNVEEIYSISVNSGTIMALYGKVLKISGDCQISVGN